MRYFIFFCCTLLLACGSETKIVEVQDDAGVVVERYYIDVQTNQKSGVYELFDGRGRPMERAVYENDVLHGERTLFHENGEVQAVEQYERGAFVGDYRAFYENGQLELEGKYVDGSMEGIWKRYYDSGELMETVTFVSNEENGPFHEFYRNGNDKAKGEYLDGDNEHGELLLYDEAGILIKKMNCERGICRTSWEKMDEEKT